MPLTKHTRTLRHFTAMQLILGMQDVDKDGEPFYPNIAYVKKYNATRRMIPPGEDKTKKLTIMEGLALLHDLLTLVDKNVYDAFHKTLNDGSLKLREIPLDESSLNKGADIGASFMEHITNKVGAMMWEDGPHPCSYVIREVVADLLRD
jgi:hypothetical protein